MTTLVLATAIILSGIDRDDAADRYVAPVQPAVRGGFNSDVVVLALADAEPSATAAGTEASSVDRNDNDDDDNNCPIGDLAVLSLAQLRETISDLLPFAITPRTARHVLEMMPDASADADTGGVDLASYMRRQIAPRFATMYRAVAKRVAMMRLPRIQNGLAIVRATIVGTISTYNPYRDGAEEGGPQTASGEPYDPAAWTAAIKTDLRSQFGGVRYGRLYQPTFALVESGDKQVIVKINDVGPLRQGRVLDLNERSMRHFDPFLTRGLIENVRITLLPGEDWTPGPVGEVYAFTIPQWRASPVQLGAFDSTSWQIDSELGRLPEPLARFSHPLGTEDVRAEIRPSTGG